MHVRVTDCYDLHLNTLARVLSRNYNFIIALSRPRARTRASNYIIIPGASIVGGCRRVIADARGNARPADNTLSQR